MLGIYQRKLSVNERMFLASAVIRPVANQIVVEGSGYVDMGTWQSAIEKASIANPGSRLILKGFLGSCHWRDSGINPPILQIGRASCRERV